MSTKVSYKATPRGTGGNSIVFRNAKYYGKHPGGEVGMLIVVMIRSMVITHSSGDILSVRPLIRT